MSDVRSREEKTLSGSMNGEQPAQTHLQHTVNTKSKVLPTVDPTGVRVEETCIPQQSGVRPSHSQYYVSLFVLHPYRHVFCVFICPSMNNITVFHKIIQLIGPSPQLEQIGGSYQMVTTKD